MERTGVAALIEILEGSGVIVLEVVLNGRIAEECLQVSIYCLMGQCDEKLSRANYQIYSIYSMGFIWHLATPTPEDCESKKQDGSEYHWSD